VNTNKPEQIRILGVGNVLTSDDAVGPYVVRTLAARFEFPETVEVLDVGTPGLDFTPYLADARAVIVVDTVRTDQPPGTIRIYRRDDLLAGPPPARTNPHEPGLREGLMAAELSDTAPEEVVLVGVTPQSTAAGTGLSQPVSDAVAELTDLVINELERLGKPATHRSSPKDPDIWWESSPQRSGSGPS